MLNFLRSAPAAPRLNASDAVARAALHDITVIDVREFAEVRATGQAAGALNIPLSILPLKANPKGPDFDARIDPAKPVAVYCTSGARSGMAAQALTKLGYEAHNIGGFGDWRRAGGAVSQ